MEKVRAELALFSGEKVCSLHLTSLLLPSLLLLLWTIANQYRGIFTVIVKKIYNSTYSQSQMVFLVCQLIFYWVSPLYPCTLQKETSHVWCLTYSKGEACKGMCCCLFVKLLFVLILTHYFDLPGPHFSALTQNKWS